MANGLFHNYRDLRGGAGTHTLPDLVANDIRIALIDVSLVGGGAVSLSTDIDYADVSAGAVGTPVAVTSKTFGSVGVGVFDHADATWTSVAAGDAADEVVYYDFESASATTSPLICRFDTFSSGMPVTPNGGDIDFQVNASGVFTS